MLPAGDRVARIGTALGGLKPSGTLAFDRRLFSLGLLQAWVFLVFHSAVVIPVGVVTYGSVYSAALVAAVLVLTAGFFAKYSRPARMRVLVVAVLLSVAGTVGTHLIAGGGVARLVGPALVGVGVGLLAPFVGKVFSSADLKSAAAQTFGSYALATLIYFIVLGLPSPLNVAVVCVLPVALFGVLVSHRPPRPHHTAPTRDEIREMVRSRPIVMFFFGVGLVGIAFGFSLALCGGYGAVVFTAANQWGVFASGIFAVLCCVTFLISKKGFSFESYFRPVVPIIVIGFLLLRLSTVASGAFIIVGFQLADMLIWIVLSWIASHSGLPQRVYCVGKGSIYLGMLVGALTASLIHAEPGLGSPTETVATIVVYLLILAVVYVFNNSTVNIAIKTSFNGSDPVFIARTIELKCEELGKRFDLTSREREMLAYLAQGRTLPYIEAELHISHGTVSSHRDHIYAKLGVHSRQDLLDLFSDVSGDQTPRHAKRDESPAH